MAVAKRHPTKEYRYFLYDPQGAGMMFFRDLDVRAEEAKKVIAEWLDCGEWAEEVEGILAGEVSVVARKTNVTPRPPENEIDEDGCDQEGNYWTGDCEETCNYEMVCL